MIELMIDSGSDVNALSETDWLNLQSEYIENRAHLENLRKGDGKRRVTAYASSMPLEIEATFWAWINVQGISEPSVYAKFFVIRGASKSLLSRASAISLGILRMGLQISTCELKPHKIAAGQEFPYVPDELVHFDVDPSVPPTKNAYYSIPAAYREKAKERLEQMKVQGILEKVIKAPRYISGMSAVPKGKSDFRLVVNMKGPNKSIKRPFYRLPTIDDMRSKLVGAKVFSKLDIKSAFHHLLLDEESRELTTFHTDSGMLRFTRLVFGVNCAPEIFQRMMDTKLAGIPGVIVYIDDILIFAESLDELKARTARVLSVLSKNNLTLNEDKCEFEKRETKFLGHRLSAEGFAIDDDKVREVRNFKSPENATDLRSFLGLASYVSDYIPTFADMVAPMREVLKPKIFEWTLRANKSFECTKEAIASCTLRLGFFDENLRTVLYTDASPYALGAVLVQIDENDRPRIISFASKVLTKTESLYAQVQKEALGVVWGVERFYYYLLGRRFTIRTDAKGVSFIFGRERTTCKRALNRAEGWAFRLSAYDYTIEWIKGKENIADSPSRLCMDPMKHPGRIEIPGEIGSLEVNWNKLSTSSGILTAQEISEYSQIDAEIVAVLEAVDTGVWPEELVSFRSMREELRRRGDILVKSGCYVIPKALRNQTLQVSHAGHPGQAAMKSIMRERVWWPGMPTDIIKWVENCEGCTLAARREPPVPMLRTTLPDAPWDKLAIDFNGPHAACGGQLIVVLVDYFSRYLFADFVKSTDIKCTVAFLDGIFARFGFPATIRSDNGPPFNGADWLAYCNKRGITAEFSTPGHPQQNGLVERYMQLINKSVTIAIETGRSSVQSLAETIDAHNSAAHRTTGEAPEVLFFSRKLRRRLPLPGKASVVLDQEALRERDEWEKFNARDRENQKRRARSPVVKVGDEVVLKRIQKAKDQTVFAPARFTVTDQDHGDFSLRGADGQVLKRNIVQLKKVRGEDHAGDETVTEQTDEMRQQTDPTQVADDSTEVQIRPQRQRRQTNRLLFHIADGENQ